jgi:DNA-directed RNA polymerase specialized sigma24 family protein
VTLYSKRVLVDSPSTPGGPSDFQQELLALRQDPQVRITARKLVGDLDLAEDLNQTVCGKLAALKHPERIENIRRYYFRVLRNEASKLYTLRQEIPFEDPDSIPAATQPVDEKVCGLIRDQSWFERFAAQREDLQDAVPARSDDPGRYQRLILNTAGQVLRDAINGEPCDADTNSTLRAAYPGYFAQPGAAVNTCHQRFRRARADVRALLQTVVSRDELT